MDLDAAKLTALRDELILLRARGIRSTMFDGKRVEYTTDADMAAAIADLETRIRRASSTRPRAVSFHSSKGV